MKVTTQQVNVNPDLKAVYNEIYMTYNDIYTYKDGLNYIKIVSIFCAVDYKLWVL